MSAKFNEKYVVQVDSMRMLSVFSGSNIGHPYRYQPYVKLVLPFEEYRLFITKMVELSLSWLTFDVAMYKRALEQEANDNLLLRLYYMDLSKAVMNEFLLAVACNKDCTVISQCFMNDEFHTYNMDELDSLLRGMTPDGIKKGLDSIKNDIIIDLSMDNVSVHNKVIFNYAMLLRILSYQPEPIRFNIV